MGKKSVRIAPDDEKSLMTDPAPMATNDDVVDMHKDVEAAAPSELRPKRSFLHRAMLHRGDHHPSPPSPVPSEKKQPDDDDDDDDFDWNDDPDQPKPRRRKTTRERIHAAMQRPCCWNYLSPFAKRLIFAIVGSCIFISAAICVYALLPEPTEEERAQPGFKNVRSNLQCWLYWAAFQWHIFWLTTVVVEAVPSAVSLWTKLFKGRRSERVKSAMEYYLSVKRYLTLLLLSSWNWGSWAFLIDYPFNSVKNQGYTTIIFKVFACIFVACCWLFAQKVIVQLIATRFHKEAFSDRLQQNKYALKILDTLSKSEARRSRPDGLRNRRPNSGSSTSDKELQSNMSSAYSTGIDHDRATGNDPKFFNQFQKRIQNMMLTDQPQIRSTIDRNKVDINSTDYAKKVARKLFYSLAYPNELPPTSDEAAKKSLEVNHFAPYFQSREEAEKAFSVFDKDGNGNLTRREFRDTVLEIYKERKALAQCVRDTSQALGKIDMLLLVFSIIITTFISLAIFNVDVWHSLLPLGSCLLALTFVFGDTCKNTFENVIFLFVTHPYDAGDYLLIDDTFLLVHNLGLMGTVFIRGDGQLLYAPTTVLRTKLIVNVRRSPDMGETIIINVDFRTPTERLNLLHSRLSEWVNNNSRDFAPGFDVRVTDIIDVNQIILSLWLPHKGNWQDLGKRFQRRTKFMIALKDILTELDIRYELPAQRFTQSMGEQSFLHTQGTQQASSDGSSITRVTPQSFSQGAQCTNSNTTTVEQR
ncbi:hypothetical protein O0I10_002083 [Lichtheimia ornata]|uniref:EF-hand domain-containing protein n=1 Tax=Lichtheimia ornata TaxID=688661 RepID=A0AAD7XYY6_9FUNG|nr:uncharacterized protein O0I10_002083 [Lichtheimia ornata]KAJ8662389.1 hypothetical protein O0I10_002083 [Lichtheimia ornata]